VFNPHNLNVYAYAHQNPVNLIDPNEAAVITGSVVVGWIIKSGAEGLSDVALDAAIAYYSGEVNYEYILGNFKHLYFLKTD
jgi:hypothetical protein